MESERGGGGLKEGGGVSVWQGSINVKISCDELLL